MHGWQEMNPKENQLDSLIQELQERAKELNCLYQIEELLNNTNAPIEELFKGVIRIIPPGIQYPEVCQVRILYDNEEYTSPDYRETPWMECTPISVQENPMGQLCISYKREVPLTDGNVFLKEEVKLIETIADRIGHTLLHKGLRRVFTDWAEVREEISKETDGKWRPIVDTLRRSDIKLFIYIARKMLHYLCWIGVDEAKEVLEKFGTIKKIQGTEALEDINRPSQKQTMDQIQNLSHEIFRIASETLTEDEVVFRIQKWIKEDKTRFLVKAIEGHSSSLDDLVNAITRFQYMEPEEIYISPPVLKGLRVSMIRRFLSDHLEFINIAKNFIDIKDYFGLIQHVIFPSDSRGKLGGKGSGLFLACNILSKASDYCDQFPNLKAPKTWYLTSDGLSSFVNYNNLDEVIEQKYKDIDEVRVEYPNIIQIFKNSYFPPEIIKGLSITLDQFDDRPIVVRSSSLLEDRAGAVFSGKYKSLFLANQGNKEQRLEALMDAIAEVYASTFAPDPIEYRAERGLLEFHEEMGILMQEVVGTQVGKYFFPAFAGVAFSSNEFRWSPRIGREDGLIRLTPGLGTRAVDRLADDYPILIAPGKPDLRVNVSPDEVMRYSPKKIDVINLETNTFETIEISEILKTLASQIPGVQNIVSQYKDGMIQRPTSAINLDFENDDLIVTFEGLFQRTPFIEQMHRLLSTLEDKMGIPVDVEFAHDGKDLYLLQCRAQSYVRGAKPSAIPRKIPEDKLVFSANQYISNGDIPDIKQIVYIDPESYTHLLDLDTLQSVGRVVGKLNKLLPKREFILMGPGRWGSRGDIKLGVNVTYADINNTAMLVEIARRKGNYIPELSFGTHFFQDLVESSIFYLPLYPDEKENVFNEEFFLKSQNRLPELLPEFASLADTVHVIDVPGMTEGLILRILLNADIDKAVGFLTRPDHEA